MPDQQRPISLRRRLVLKRIGLAGLAYAAPVILPLSAARASDSISRASRPSRPSRPTRRSRPAPRAQASVPSAPSRPAPVAPPPELVVTIEDRDDVAILEAEGFRLLGIERVGLLGLWLVRLGLPAGLGLDAARDRARDLLPRAGVESNDLYRTSEMLCESGGCDAFSLVNWPQPEPCGATPVIGMIDSGINPEHDAFTGRDLVVDALDLGEREPAGLTHGTAIAALLLGRPDSRTPGLLPDARLIAVEAFHADSVGEAADVFALVRAIDRLVAQGVDVINMSFAGPDNPVLADAISRAREEGVAIVAAAGNDGPRAEPLFPAAYESAIAVTAVDRREQVYRLANAGEHLQFAAPGVNLWTAASISGGRLRTGTSYAAPFVTAAIAAARHENPDMEIDELVQMLADRALDLGEPGFDETYGWGLVQANSICLLNAGGNNS